MSNRFFKYALLFISLTLAACTKTSNDQSLKVPVVKNDVWIEKSFKDEIRGNVISSTHINSEVVEHSAGDYSMARVSLIKWDDVSPYAVRIELIPKAVMSCATVHRRAMNARIAYKFDNSPPGDVLARCDDGMISATLSDDDAFNFIRFAGRKPIKLLVEIPFYQKGGVVYRFTVPPLIGNWASYSKSIDGDRPS